MSDILTHLPHFEDVALLSIFEGSPAGLDRAVGIVDALIAQAEGKKSDVQVRHKIDGRPALILGSTPGINNGQFFIKTKWANCPPISKPEDIPSSLSDIRLSVLIDVLAGSTIDGVYHADLLYLPDTITRSDAECSFAPNTIEYAIDSDSHLFVDLHHSIGLCVHSTYSEHKGALVYNKGSDVDHLHVKDNLKAFTLDNKWNGTLEPPDVKYLEELKHSLVTYTDIVSHKLHLLSPLPYEIYQHFLIYLNTEYRSEGVVLSGHGFREFIHDRIGKAVDGRKTVAGKQRAELKYKDVMLFLEKHYHRIDDIIVTYKIAKLLKTGLMQVVGPIDGITQRIDGKVDHIGEGLVISSKSRNAMMKFVPRDTFSRANFKRND